MVVGKSKIRPTIASSYQLPAKKHIVPATPSFSYVDRQCIRQIHSLSWTILNPLPTFILAKYRGRVHTGSLFSCDLVAQWARASNKPLRNMQLSYWSHTSTSRLPSFRFHHQHIAFRLHEQHQEVQSLKKSTRLHTIR